MKGVKIFNEFHQISTEGAQHGVIARHLTKAEEVFPKQLQHHLRRNIYKLKNSSVLLPATLSGAQVWDLSRGSHLSLSTHFQGQELHPEGHPVRRTSLSRWTAFTGTLLTPSHFVSEQHKTKVSKAITHTETARKQLKTFCYCFFFFFFKPCLNLSVLNLTLDSYRTILNRNSAHLSNRWCLWAEEGETGQCELRKKKNFEKSRTSNRLMASGDTKHPLAPPACLSLATEHLKDSRLCTGSVGTGLRLLSPSILQASCTRRMVMISL